jgi:peptidoglycan/xylan/chitin deacetylase (PgdA/CDA1 family)
MRFAVPRVAIPRSIHRRLPAGFDEQVKKHLLKILLPPGRPRLWAGAAAGLLILGWLSGLSPRNPPSLDLSAAAPPATRPLSSTHPVQRKRPPPKPAPVDCHKKKCVALTFDDGPGPYTARLLRMLAARHARVTFFLIGGNIRGREALVRQELAQGNAIGDHTWSHPDLTHLSSGAVRSQLTRTLKEIEKAGGGSTHLMRPPYGSTDKHVAKVARSLGLAQIVWDVDTDDWLDRNATIVAHRAVTRAHRGDIILMHDIHPTTVDAVPRILRGLAKRGFTFVTVPELLAAHPLHPGKAYFDGR